MTSASRCRASSSHSIAVASKFMAASMARRLGGSNRPFPGNLKEEALKRCSPAPAEDEDLTVPSGDHLGEANELFLKSNCESNVRGASYSERCCSSKREVQRR